MARRKKTSTAEDLINVVAMLPWWAAMVLAVVLYVALHHLVAEQAVATFPPGQAGVFIVQTFGKTLASFGQYLVPLICLAGAGISAWRRHERRTLIHNGVHSDSAVALDGMTWRQFEHLVSEAFRMQGYKVLQTGAGGADGGVDLVLKKGSEKFLVQCMQWRPCNVGVDVVRELYGVMAARGADGGFIVTSGRFTADATEFAPWLNVTLIDGPELSGLIRQARAARDSICPIPTPTAKPTGVAPTAPAAASTAPGPSTSPACPKCLQPMVKRTARRGTNAGGEFWGCTGFPECRGTSQVA